MKATMLYGPRFEEQPGPVVIKPTDATSHALLPLACAAPTCSRTAASRPLSNPVPMGHEYCGVVEEIGSSLSGPFDIVRG